MLVAITKKTAIIIEEDDEERTIKFFFLLLRDSAYKDIGFKNTIVAK